MGIAPDSLKNHNQPVQWVKLDVTNDSGFDKTLRMYIPDGSVWDGDMLVMHLVMRDPNDDFWYDQIRYVVSAIGAHIAESLNYELLKVVKSYNPYIVFITQMVRPNIVTLPEPPIHGGLLN